MEMIDNLVNTTKKMGCSTVVTIERKDGINVEVGAYPKGMRPAKEVLDALYEWAEKEGLDNVTEKIIELEESDKIEY